MSTPRTKPPYTFNFLKEHLPSSEGQRLFAQEMAIMAATSAAVNALTKAGISQAELAQRIGKTPSFVSQVLSGTRNMTLRTLADFLWACESQIRDLDIQPLGESVAHHDAMDAWLDREPRVRTSTEGLTTPTKTLQVVVTTSSLRASRGAVA